MIIPIGHDQGSLRRIPVVTFTIIAICFALHLGYRGPTRDERSAAMFSLGEAMEYYAKNPDLDLDPRAKRVFEQILMQRDAGERRRLSKLIEERRRPDDAPPRAERQAKLDSMVQLWTSQIERTADWRFGFVPADFDPLKLLTYMFVHGGFMHVFFNMLFLYLTGPFIEDNWGRPLFVGFYVTGGIVAALGFAGPDLDLDVPLVGASGAVAAVMGAFLIRYPTAWIRFWSVIPTFWFSLPAWLVLSLWFVGEIYSARGTSSFSTGGVPQVAYLAHVWGFVFGAGVAGVLRAFHVEERYLDDAIAMRLEAQSDPVMRDVERQLQRGNQEQACKLLADKIAREPSNDDVAAVYWQLSRLGPMLKQPSINLRIIQNDLRYGRNANALERWEEIAEQLPDLAPDLPLSEALARALLHVVNRDGVWALVERGWNGMERTTAPALIVGWAKLVIEVESPLADVAVARVVEDPRVSPGEKRRVQEMRRHQTLRVDV